MIFFLNYFLVSLNIVNNHDFTKVNVSIYKLCDEGVFGI